MRRKVKKEILIELKLHNKKRNVKISYEYRNVMNSITQTVPAITRIT